MNELYDGFNDLINDFEKLIQNVSEPVKVLEIGAKEFTNDLLKLAKPISKIKKSTYTHLIKTFSYKVKRKEVEVGWGKYYGPMVEKGTKKMDSKPHFEPCFEKNKEKYYKKMKEKIGLL